MLGSVLLRNLLILLFGRGSLLLIARLQVLLDLVGDLLDGVVYHLLLLPGEQDGSRALGFLHTLRRVWTSQQVGDVELGVNFSQVLCSVLDLFSLSNELDLFVGLLVVGYLAQQLLYPPLNLQHLLLANEFNDLFDLLRAQVHIVPAQKFNHLVDMFDFNDSIAIVVHPRYHLSDSFEARGVGYILNPTNSLEELLNRHKVSLMLSRG